MANDNPSNDVIRDKTPSDPPATSSPSPPSTSSSQIEKLSEPIEKKDIAVGSPDKSEDAEKKEGAEGSTDDLMKVLKMCGTTELTFYIIGTIAAIASGIAMPMMTVVFGGFVTTFTDFGTGRLTPDEFMDEAVKYTLYFIYLFVARFVVTYVYTTCFKIGAIKLVKKLRIRFIEKILSQEVSYFDTLGSGAVSVRVTTNANQVQSALAEKTGLVVFAISMFFSSFIIAIITQWKLALIGSSIIPALFIITGITGYKDTITQQEIAKHNTAASSLVEEILSSIRIVKSTNAAGKLRAKYREFLDLAVEVGMTNNIVWGMQLGFEFASVYLGYALIFWQGVKMVSTGEITDAGKVITVFMSILIALMALPIVAPHFPTFAKASSAAHEIIEVIERESQIDATSTEGIVLDDLKGDIEVRDLTFAYPSRPDTTVLNNLSLKIPAKKVTALVGASGSGKSTIIGLLERWVDSKQGGVYLDGVKVQDLNLRWLRRQIGLVQQEPVLFNNTVFNNVAFGLVGSEHENASEEKKRELVKEACIAANAHDFISKLPQGYDTECGDRAGLLSGGQKQRIAIARSIIKDPSILLLDEATSALDPKSEGIVQAALDKAAAQEHRTTIVIAHKLATVRNADKIIVMRAGQVVEEGTHQSLIELGGQYARLVKAQDLGVDDEEKSDSEGDDVELTKTLTRKESIKQAAFVDEEEGEVPKEWKKVGLLKCAIFLVKELYPMVWPHYITLTITSLIGGAIYPIQAILIAAVVDAFTLPPGEMREKGDFYALMFFIAGLVLLAAYFVAGWCLNHMSTLLRRHFGLSLFTSIVSQPVSFFDQTTNTAGSLTSKLSTHPTHLQNMSGMNLTLILVIIVNIISSTILALITGWKLALATLFSAFPVVFAAGFLQIYLEGKMDAETAEVFADSGRFAAEAVGAIRTVSSLTLESNIISRYATQLAGLELNAMKKSMRTMILFSIAQSIEMLAMGFAFWYGAKLQSTGEYNTRQFFVVFVAVIFSAQAAGQFFAYSSDLTSAHSAANYVLWLRSLTPETPSGFDENEEADDSRPETNGDLAMEDVDFAYSLRPDHKVLKELNLSAPKSSFIALVGPSGCGKSTVIQLLLRFYAVLAGRVTLDGENVEDIPLAHYRRQISLVSQEPTLYMGTIRENILLGLPKSMTEGLSKEEIDEKVIRACKDANIWTFIESLPSGLDTECGSRGAQFSGGQRQRLAIARALIRDPKILLLDEATSALDTESERVVQSTLDGAGKGRTTVAVAHRLSTVRGASEICVFEGGRVVERGTHEELIRLGGRYKELCEMQRLDN
ncbi:multidrug resistance protein 1 [Ascobolus immersus RN42]|uniref:Multidrug resistance protein 1 n=1 Tax=Ascobolus immersus RN42 TaxID=1160509 RepID=A0A3N4HLB3_ASCIM|nr:multidrug resistance protein 1 [Ascobolus immersus RN42]